MDPEQCRHTLSRAYAYRADPSVGGALDYLKKWERDLGVRYTPEQEGCLMYFTYRASISSCYQESGYKPLAWWYRVLTDLHMI